jgi:hypothetical protein
MKVQEIRKHSMCVSRDLPFAQKRFCGAEGLENVINLSDFRILVKQMVLKSRWSIGTQRPLLWLIQTVPLYHGTSS